MPNKAQLNKYSNGTFTSEFLDVRVCWTVLYPQGEYVGLSYILKALFTNNRGGCKTVQHCLTYSNIILTSKNSDVNVPLSLSKARIGRTGQTQGTFLSDVACKCKLVVLHIDTFAQQMAL